MTVVVVVVVGHCWDNFYNKILPYLLQQTSLMRINVPLANIFVEFLFNDAHRCLEQRCNQIVINSFRERSFYANSTSPFSSALNRCFKMNDKFSLNIFNYFSNSPI